MTKGKRPAAAQFQLPEAMIQHIQSFLSGKEAARTTLFSKAWYSAWLTRPNLDFVQDDFKKDNERSAIRLWKFVNKVMQRYDKLNLKIDSLRLAVNEDAKYYVKELIVKAMKMGATALDFKFRRYGWQSNGKFALPNEVFGSQNLITLSVSGCKICMEADEEINCSKLKFLNLDKVSFEFDSMMWKIFSSCPLIESLSLSDPDSELEKLNVGSVVNMFRNLKCLTVNVDYCDNVMEISSPSLEYVNFCEYRAYYGHKILKAKFNVPKIRKFTFSGSTIPKLSFQATTSTWESHITIKRWAWATPPSATWFLELNKLLKTLSSSKVSLSLEILSEKRIDCAGKIPSLTKPEVESLAISGPCSVDPAFFYCLFQCCRPIYVTQRLFRKSKRGKNIITNDFMKFAYKRMMHQVSLNSCFAYQKTSALCNIEEVSVEFYDESVSAWRPRLLDTSKCPEADKQVIRLHLRWGQ